MHPFIQTQSSLQTINVPLSFHLKDRDVLTCQLEVLKQDYPLSEPWDLQDIFKVAQLCFASQFSLLQDCLCHDPVLLWSTDVSWAMECWFGPDESNSQLYWWKPSQSDEDLKLENIIRKPQGLSLHDPTYAVLCTVQVTFPLPKCLWSSQCYSRSLRCLHRWRTLRLWWPNVSSNAIVAPNLSKRPALYINPGAQITIP